MVLSAAVLGLGICCRNHVVFESQVKYHKHSLLRVSRATASVANQFPATWYSFLFSVPARKVVLELLSAWIVVAVVFVVDSLSIYAINKQLKPIYNYAASIIEVVCVSVCAPWRHSCHCCPLTSDQGQAGRQAFSDAVPSAWDPWQLSTEAEAGQHLRRVTFTFAGTSATTRWNPCVCEYVCTYVCLCVCA